MLWIIFCFIVIIFILLFTRVYITCRFTYKENRQLLFVCVHVYHIRLFKRNINLENEDEINIDNLIKGETFLNRIRYLQGELRRYIQKIKEINDIAKHLLKRAQVQQLSWHTRVGTGNASTTGIAVGGIWTVKGALIGIISDRSNLKCKPVINVTPYFNQPYIESKIDCIVSIRVGKAIYALIKAMRKTRIKKEIYI